MTDSAYESIPWRTAIIIFCVAALVAIVIGRHNAHTRHEREARNSERTTQE